LDVGVVWLRLHTASILEDVQRRCASLADVAAALPHERFHVIERPATARVAALPMNRQI
jgi:hypothetical protein